MFVLSPATSRSVLCGRFLGQDFAVALYLSGLLTLFRSSVLSVVWTPDAIFNFEKSILTILLAFSRLC